MNYIDTSNSSIGIGLVIFVSILLISRYYLNIHYAKQGLEEDNKFTIVYSLFVSAVSAMVCLVLLKQFFIYKGSIAILDEPYSLHPSTSISAAPSSASSD